MKLGKFITLEGGEGTGKSTQARQLVKFLRRRGIRAIATREVGGAPSAEEIRALWLHKKNDHWDPLTEILLVMAARREHLVKTVWPALERGIWVVSDRYVDSTRVYQGMAMGLGVRTVDAFYAAIAGRFWPDLTLLLDCPVKTGLSRMKARRGRDDRFQQQQKKFHQTLRKGFLGLAQKDRERFRIINAQADEKAVAEALQDAVVKRFRIRKAP